MALLGFFEPGDQLGGRQEADAKTFEAKGATQAFGEVRFSRAGVADEADVAVLADPLAAGQLQDLELRNGRRDAEIKSLQALAGRELGLLEASR